MLHKDIRVRFAPSPTGMMHLGNIRTALLNYLFGKKNNGTFVLRIEDTDPERIFDPGAKLILKDLAWLNLSYQEGGDKGGPYTPYFQSQRNDIYQKQLEILLEKGMVYRCFCTEELLQKKRQRQIALKQPPRYDRACTLLEQTTIEQNLEQKIPFIWRFKINHDKKITINDLARGSVVFDMKNFSDFPLTRKNGSFTFIFANVIDDIKMLISHVFRGEDHLSNTANQAAIYEAFDVPLPIFWHMPILCNTTGKKLSKRDFGFSLKDLKDAGFLPEALCNYLGIIGSSFKEEIMDLEILAQAINFKNLNPTGAIKYDLEKLKWVNHKWIEKLDPEKLAEASLPFLRTKYPDIDSIEKQRLKTLLQVVKSEMITLEDVSKAVRFNFEDPAIGKNALLEFFNEKEINIIHQLIMSTLTTIENPQEFISSIKTLSKEQNIPIKKMFTFVRLMLTGNVKGPQIADIIDILGKEEASKRLREI